MIAGAETPSTLPAPAAPASLKKERRCNRAISGSPLSGSFSFFGVTNILRVIEGGTGGFANFDVAGMTLGMIGGALFLLGQVVDQADRLQTELDEMI
jgi:hypothetical protein